MATLEKMINILKARNEENKESVLIYEAVLQVMQKMEGQQITRRVATAVKKLLPDHVVSYNTDLSFYRLLICKENYENRSSFNLGYKNSIESTIQVDKGDEHRGFRYFNMSFENTKAEIEVIEDFLGGDAVFAARQIDALNNLVEEANKIRKNIEKKLPDSYALRELFAKYPRSN